MEKFRIAAFDFDGTVTTKDTLWEFFKHTHRPWEIFLNTLILAPMLILYKIGLIENGRAKQMVFRKFYKGWSIEDFNERCDTFSTEVDRIVRPEILNTINKLSQEGATVIIVCASIENWVKPWASQNKIDHVLATNIEVDGENRITGRFSTPNCHGIEKKNRILNRFPERELYHLSAFGDSRGDREMLEFADEAQWVK